MSQLSGKIQTVLGIVEPKELGFTHMHEHLLITVLPEGSRNDIGGERITLENVGYFRRYWLSNPQRADTS
jgi:predicted metal-dependent phosphotriesterase family hydrolase